MQFIAKGQNYREWRREFSVILSEDGVGVSEAIHCGGIGLGIESGIGVAEQEGCIRVANRGWQTALARTAAIDVEIRDATVKLVLTQKLVAKHVVVVIGHAAEVSTEFEGVFLLGPRQSIEELKNIATLLRRIGAARCLEASDLDVGNGGNVWNRWEPA